MTEVTAYYTTRRGGSAGRAIRSAAEAERFLRRGGDIVLRDASGETVGERRPHPDNPDRWMWWFDSDAFSSDEVRDDV